MTLALGAHAHVHEVENNSTLFGGVGPIHRINSGQMNETDQSETFWSVILKSLVMNLL